MNPFTCETSLLQHKGYLIKKIQCKCLAVVNCLHTQIRKQREKKSVRNQATKVNTHKTQGVKAIQLLSFSICISAARDNC